MQGKKRYSRKIRKIYWQRIVIFITVICLAVFSIAIFLSIKSGSFTIKSKSYYFVQAAQFEDFSEAVSLCEQIKLKGGAGEIFNSEGIRVLTSVYIQKSDAEKVSQSLIGQGYENPAVFKFSTRQLKMASFEDKNVTKNVSDCLKMPANIIESLYKTSISLDKGETTDSYLLREVELIVQKLNSALLEAKDYPQSISSKIQLLITMLLAETDTFYEDIRNFGISASAKALNIRLALSYDAGLKLF